MEMEVSFYRESHKYGTLLLMHLSVRVLMDPSAQSKLIMRVQQSYFLLSVRCYICENADQITNVYGIAAPH
jgi:hypothetical protein